MTESGILDAEVGTTEEEIQRLKAMFGDPISKSWSANFEDDPYRDRPDLILRESLMAIAATKPGNIFVNLVTPGELGDPAGYLLPAIRQALGDTVELEEIGQCGCGGYVVRAYRRETK